MDDEPENNVNNWIKVLEDTSTIQPSQSSFQKTPSQAVVLQSQVESLEDEECSFSPEFITDSSDLSLATQSLAVREESQAEWSTSIQPPDPTAFSTVELRGSIAGSSCESFSIKSPRLLTWEHSRSQENLDRGTQNIHINALGEVSNPSCSWCKSWARDGLNCAGCVTYLILSRRREIDQSESSLKMLVGAAKELDKMKKSTIKEQHDLRMKKNRRRVIALQQLLKREKTEFEALVRAHEEKQSDLAEQELNLKKQRENLERVKLLVESNKGNDLKAKIKLKEKEENVLHKEQRKYILDGLMQLLPIDIINNSINGIVIPRSVTPSCVYIPNLEQIYGYIIIYMLKLEQFYTTQHFLRTRLSYKGTRSMISDGKQEYQLYPRGNSKKGIKSYQNAIDLFDKHLMELAIRIGVPRYCLKRFSLIGNLWNILTFIHEHKIVEKQNE